MPHLYSSMSSPKSGGPIRPFISEDAHAIAQFSDEDLQPFALAYQTMAPRCQQEFWLMRGNFASKLAYLTRHAYCQFQSEHLAIFKRWNPEAF